jgi:Domain of unknown function (DUF6265)
MPALLSCMIFFCGCSTKMRSLSWLAGTWGINNLNGSSTIEVWKRKNAKTYSGQGLKIMQGDTTVTENLLLYTDDQEIWYVPTVLNQNNGLPVRFKMVSATEHMYVFENAEHDFPQRIVYQYKPIGLQKMQLP